MGKYKYLLKNLGIMTLSNFGSKILSFLMVPLYTRVLTTEEYGMYDFYVTTILLLTPLLSMNILDAVIRFVLEKNSEPEKIFTIGFKFCFRAIMVCSGLILINQWTGSIELFTMYPIFFLLYFSLSMIFDLFNQFARGLERLYDVAVAGVINTFVLVSLNVLFLIGLKLGLTGYFAAYCCAFGDSQSLLGYTDQSLEIFRCFGFETQYSAERYGKIQCANDSSKYWSMDQQLVEPICDYCYLW